MASGVSESILVRRLRGEKTERVPVWFMRQAGRYLPEYRELRKKQSMLEAIATPEVAAEITLQPLRRFDLDGAIIFADILNPLIGMGVELDFVAGEGPKIFNPIKSPADVQKLRVPDVEENVGGTLEAMRIVTRELSSRGVPLLGFAGAPFTLASYLLHESDPPALAGLKRFIITEPAAWGLLCEKLGAMIVDYAVAQAQAGAVAVQLFDSWVGALSPAEFTQWVAPTLRTILSEVRKRVSIPLIYFSTGTAGLLPEFGKVGFDALGVDWRVRLSTAAQLLGVNIPLQGNLDPVFMTRPFEEAQAAIEAVLKDGALIPAPHIFNVGHGLTPDANPDTVARTIEAVHQFQVRD